MRDSITPSPPLPYYNQHTEHHESTDPGTEGQDSHHPGPSDSEPGHLAQPVPILVRVGAVALNRVDWLYAANPVAAQDRHVIGSDFAGEVAKLGTITCNHTDPRTKAGPRVASFVQGAGSINERPRSFARYVATERDLDWHVPSTLSLEQAATVNLRGLTAAQGIFTRLKFPSPFVQTEGFGHLNRLPEEVVSVLINAAAASLGLFAAQIVSLAE